MNYYKIKEKFRYYWLMDDRFRGLIYNYFYNFQDDMIFSSNTSFYQLLVDNKYRDYTCVRGMDSMTDVWSFLVGLSFPSRGNEFQKLNKFELFHLGEKWSLGGKLFDLWNKVVNEPVSDISIHCPFFLLGRGAAKSGPEYSFEEIQELNLDEQSYYLLGRDSILNRDGLEYFLKNKKLS